MNVYLAGALRDSHSIEMLAAQLRVFHNVVSTWHSIVAPGSVDPASEATRTRILERNLAELTRADAVVAITPDREGKCTYYECGWANALGLPCILVQAPEARFLADSAWLNRRIHMGARYVDDVLSALGGLVSHGLVATEAACT